MTTKETKRDQKLQRINEKRQKLVSIISKAQSELMELNRQRQNLMMEE